MVRKTVVLLMTLLLGFANSSGAQTAAVDQTFQLFLKEWEAAQTRFINGDPAQWKHHTSQRPDVTIVGGFGGVGEKGPKAVLARAGAVLEALEERARGLEPLSEELPLLSRAPPPFVEPEPEEAPGARPHPALDALAALDPDALSPREAQEALYRLKSMLDDAVFAPQHALSSPG